MNNTEINDDEVNIERLLNEFSIQVEIVNKILKLIFMHLTLKYFLRIF